MILALGDLASAAHHNQSDEKVLNHRCTVTLRTLVRSALGGPGSPQGDPTFRGFHVWTLVDPSLMTHCVPLSKSSSPSGLNLFHQMVVLILPQEKATSYLCRVFSL